MFKGDLNVLTLELRTMDMKEVLELWDTNKEKLKLKLLDDYEDLAKEYRKQCKIYTQETNQYCEIFNQYCSSEFINYQAELGINEKIRGKIKFTKDFKENIKIALKVVEGKHHSMMSINSYELKHIIKFKAQEIVATLRLLDVKVSYEKDFLLNTDKWKNEDLEELEEFKRKKIGN